MIGFCVDSVSLATLLKTATSSWPDKQSKKDLGRKATKQTNKQTKTHAENHCSYQKSTFDVSNYCTELTTPLFENHK